MSLVFLRPLASDFRNPKLAAVFYRLKLIEAYGTGMPKIMKAYDGSGLTPKIEVTANAFKITLPNRNAEQNQQPAAPLPTENEKKILAFVDAHGFVVRSDVDTLLGVSQATANRILKRMVTKGMLYQEGSGKKTTYKK